MTYHLSPVDYHMPVLVLHLIHNGLKGRFSLIKYKHTQISNIAGDLSMNMSPWNKDRIIGQKRPLQISHIWGSESGLNWKVKRAI